MKIHSVIDKLNPELRSIDTAAEKKRVREFYAMPPKDALAIFEVVAESNGFKDKIKLWTITEEQKEEALVATEIAEVTRKKAKFFTFPSCGGHEQFLSAEPEKVLLAG